MELKLGREVTLVTRPRKISLSVKNCSISWSKPINAFTNRYRELELSWLRRCEDYATRIKLLNKTNDVVWIFDFYKLEIKIEERRQKIMVQVKQLLKSPTSVVKQAAFSVLSRLLDRRPAVYMETEADGDDELTLRDLLASSIASDRIDNEISVRECLVRTMNSGAPREAMIKAMETYVGKCGRYMERIRQIHDSEDSVLFNPGKVDIPFNGDTRILSLLMRYWPQALFRGKDVFGFDVLTGAILIADEADIEQLMQNLDNARFLDLARGEVICDHTILHSAAARGSVSVFHKVKALDCGDIRSIIDWQDMSGATPLIYAACQGNYTVVKTLLELNSNPEVSDRNEQNALHHAAQNGHKEVVQLLSRNAHDQFIRTAKDTYGFTAWHVAISAGHLEIVKLLPQDWTVISDEQWSPLMLASKEGHVRVVEWLLNEQCVGDIDGVNYYGQTSLLMAVISGSLDTVKLLLLRGANASIADGNGITPCDCASDLGDLEIVSVLEESLPPAAD